VTVLSIVWGYGERYQRLSSPDHGFKSYTGVALPAGVSAIAHGSEMNDNLLHTTHYWTLAGPEASLRSLAGSFGLERSDEDAKWALPDMQRMLGLATTRDDIVEGYEGSLDGGRDRWLMILSNGRGAVFVY
jgi:hypothetical protein